MLRLVLAMALCCAPAGTGRALAAAKDPLAVEVARIDVEQAKHVDIISQSTTADGRELKIVLKPKGEQFTVNFDLTGRQFERVRITVLGVKKADVARYFTDLVKGKTYIDLMQLPGVDFYRLEGNLVIDFTTPKAAKILPPEGRLLFREIFIERDDKTPKGAKP